jgi:hypothetical protein
MRGGDVKATDLALSARRQTPAGGSIKLQVTSGFALADLPTVMEYFGTPVPGETGPQTAQRNPGRTALFHAPATSLIHPVLGGVPTLARDVVTRFEARYPGILDPGAPGSATYDGLVGFLSAVLFTVKALQSPDKTEEVKARLALMARTNFVELFSDLSPGVRGAVEQHWSDLLDVILTTSNATPLLTAMLPTSVFDNGVLIEGAKAWGMADANLARDTPLIRPTSDPVVGQHQATLKWLTIEEWFKNVVVSGRDYLVPSSHPWSLRRWAERKVAQNVLLSMGSIPHLDNPQFRGGPRLAVFENRFITPVAGQLTFPQAYRVAWNQLIFYKRLRETRAGRRPSVGDYPAYPAGTMPVGR